MIRIKRSTVMRTVYFLAALGICVIAFTGLKLFSDLWKARAVSQSPKQTMSIVIELEQRDKLFEQLKKFSLAHDFDIHIGPTTPAKVTFNIYMSRDDVVIWGGNSLNPRGYKIGFYDKDPLRPISPEVVSNLIKELEKYLIEVPNIRILEPP